MSVAPSDHPSVKESLDKIKATAPPPRGETYYFLGSTIHVAKDIWFGSYLDNQRKESGNVFTDREVAEKFAEKVRKFLMENNHETNTD